MFLSDLFLHTLSASKVRGVFTPLAPFKWVFQLRVTFGASRWHFRDINCLHNLPFEFNIFGFQQFLVMLENILIFFVYIDVDRCCLAQFSFRGSTFYLNLSGDEVKLTELLLKEFLISKSRSKFGHCMVRNITSFILFFFF